MRFKLPYLPTGCKHEEESERRGISSKKLKSITPAPVADMGRVEPTHLCRAPAAGGASGHGKGSVAEEAKGGKGGLPANHGTRVKR